MQKIILFIIILEKKNYIYYDYRSLVCLSYVRKIN